ncbi:c-type cytochrome [Ramlibacter sp.]|uniref:c-type cytochrome n=1 Tax=Ramlibacter sp. TaxID=1917967 RepID=UPI002B5286FD|nr:c-type cytochrome [Ramlibacter sp.]HWI82251.1 c-type cytochrome [Ramlibacter sp.]
MHCDHRDSAAAGPGTTRAAARRAALLPLLAALAACGGGSAGESPQELALRGRQVFRFDTFGDEAFWTGKLKMHEVIGQAVDPTTALAVGLKVDTDALPAAVVQGIRDGSVDLHSPATTVTLLKLGAVVGLQGTVQAVNGKDTLTQVGVTCALCHSTVDDSFAPGMGKRLDGWPNRDLDPGAIIALSPALPTATKAVYTSWGKGRYDPRFNLDGKSKPVVIPPAYGLQDVHRITLTGDGDELAYWNRYVAVTQMGGLGTFTEPRLNLSVTNGTVDLVTGKLPALQAYQLTLQAPPAPAGSFDAAAAGRGKAVFEGPGRCASCHGGPRFTDANTTLHPPAASMVEPETPSYAARSATRQYRTSPLAGVWQHAPYFHDGSAPTLEAVGQRYNEKMGLGLSAQQIADLAQYLKSL